MVQNSVSRSNGSKPIPRDRFYDVPSSAEDLHHSLRGTFRCRAKCNDLFQEIRGDVDSIIAPSGHSCEKAHHLQLKTDSCRGMSVFVRKQHNLKQIEPNKNVPFLCLPKAARHPNTSHLHLHLLLPLKTE